MAIDYLNRFLQKAWPYASALLKNEIIHNAKVKAQEKGLDLHVWETELDLSAPPAFSLSGSTLKLRFPAQGSYHFDGRVEKPIPYFFNPEISVYLAIWAEMTFGTGQPVISIHVDAEGNWAGDALDWLNGWEGDLESQIKKDFAEHLGFFSSGRYNPSTITTNTPPELIHGFRDLENNKAIDIVLVSDGFTASKMEDFDAVAETFKNKLTTFTNTRVNEPFLSFDSVIRIWKLHALATNPALNRVVTRYHDLVSNTEKTALANLAQLATIGPKAESVGMDVIVFMSERTTMGGDARAMAMGNLIMLPISKSSADKDASILIHELGHTNLGGLGDEYVKKDIAYRSKEPNNPNITLQKPNANLTQPVKWARWMQNPGKLPAWDHNPIKTVEGAAEYKFRLYRPAEKCKMNDSSGEVAFCAVCREALTRGIRRVLGKEAFLIEIMNTSTNVTNRIQINEVDGLNYRVRVPERGETTFYIKFLASTLPKPWKITFRSSRGPIRGNVDQDELITSMSFGDSIIIVVESLCPFIPWDNLQYRIIEVHFDLPVRNIPQAAPTVPINLTASGSPDRIGHSVLKTLSATSSDINADDIRFEFELQEFQEEFTSSQTIFSDWISWTQMNPNVRGHIKKIVGPGGYKFRVRAEDKFGHFSNWSVPKTFIVPGA
jgi:hypothetical protein